MEGKLLLAFPQPALTIDSLDPPAPRAVRLEGAGFYLHGRVDVVIAEPRRVRAIIRGARPFDVTVTSGENGRHSVTCDCAAFREQQAICRHVWAALIKIQNESLLAPPTAAAAVP
jgi:hypothetical protein